MADKKKSIFNILFLIIVFSLTFYYVFSGQDLNNIISYTKNANLLYWIPSVFCVIIFILSESFIIHYLAKHLGQKTKLTHCFLYSFTGFFFSCITPSASGGQPAQIAYMKKDGIPISVSTVILMLITITYKMVLVIIGLFVLIIRPTSVMQYLNPAIGWFWLGLGLNILFIACLFILLFNSSLAKKTVMFCLHLTNKFFHLKNMDKKEQEFEKSLLKYHECAVYFKSNVSKVFVAFFITFIQRIALFFVTYLVLRSFGITNSNVISILILQAMISVAADMMPLPGGMGITESLFITVFTPICGSVLVLPALIVSRGISFYTQLLISAVMTLVAHLIIRGEKT